MDPVSNYKLQCTQAEERMRNDLLAEYLDKQLWQFISIDEWLAGRKREGA
jgi:predicted transcriptional regulator